MAQRILILILSLLFLFVSLSVEAQSVQQSNNPSRKKQMSWIEYNINPFLSDCRRLIIPSPIIAGRAEITEVKQTATSASMTNSTVKNLNIRMRLKPKVSMKVIGGNIDFRKDGSFDVIRYNDQDIQLESDAKGIISFSIQYENSTEQVRLPMEFTYPDGRNQVAYLQLDLKQDLQPKTTLIPITNMDMQKGLCLRSQIWLGTGISAFSFNQSIPVYDAQAKFISITPLSISAEIKYFAAPTWALVAGYKSAPGKMNAGAVANVQSTQFRWDILMTELQYRPYGTVSTWGEWTLYPFAKLGLQNHSIPKLSIDDNGLVSFDSISLTNMHAGLGLNMVDKSKYFLETFLNYQMKMKSSNYDISPKMMIDGSIGGGKMLSRQMAIGLFWYGQWHQLSYAQATNANNQGNVDYFFSNFDLRLGWIF